MMASDSTKKLSELYQAEFKPDFYVAKYYPGLDAGNEFSLRNLHEFFKSFKPSESSDTSPKRILEVGSGPVPIHVLSASRWGDQIICSDFLEQNRTKFSHWLTFGRQEDERWIPYAKYVAKLESEGNSVTDYEQSATVILDRVRNSIRSVVFCDVLQSDPLLGHESGQQQFDVIISAFCLESAVSSPSEYPNVVANVASLLRPSGHLIMMGGIEGDYYFVYDKKVPRIKLTRDMINAALEKVGCQIVCWKELPRSMRPIELPIDYKALFYCVAEKK